MCSSRRYYPSTCITLGPRVVWIRCDHRWLGDLRVTELGAIRVCVQLSGGVWSPETIADRLLIRPPRVERTCGGRTRYPPSVTPEVRAAATAKQITDRYLLGLARRNGARLVTFDRALAAAGGDDVALLLRAT